MAKLRAAVLVAGRGVRMGGAEVKTLLPLDSGAPLLAHILSGLERSGVGDVLMVTGFRAETIQQFCDEYDGNISFSFVFNARYASWGNFHSVRVALDQSPGYDVLVVNSDVVVNPEVYERVVQTRGDLVLAVQRRHRLDEEDMKVQLDRRKVVAIGKDLKLRHSHGEFAGISLIRPTAVRLYQDLCNELQWRGRTQGYYEDVYADMIGRISARMAEVSAGEYAEVDKPEDVRAAIGVVRRFYGEPAAANS